VQSDISVTANFTINEYTLTYTAGEGGSIDGNTNQTVNHGEDGTQVTAIANSGYDFTGWSDGVLTANRTDINITENITVTANFEMSSPSTHTLSYTAGEGGTIDGNTNQTVNRGEDGTEVTAIPNTGYHFTSWSDGVLTENRTDTNVQDNITVTANFEINEYTLTYTAGEGGSIDGNTNQTVNHGEDGTEVTAIPNTGYHFTSWSDGVLTENRTDTNVQDNITVTANFEINEYTLTYTVGEGGSIDGNTNQTVNHGEDGTEVTAIANSGYDFTGWSDGVLTASRIDTNVQNDLSVTANFEAEPMFYTLTYAHTAGGTIDGNTLQLVLEGDDGEEIMAVPNENYHFVKWSDELKTERRRDLNINSNLFVEARFTSVIYVDENFNELTTGWGQTHFSNLNSALESCIDQPSCKYILSQEQSLEMETNESISSPFNLEQIFIADDGLEIIFPENVQITGNSSWDGSFIFPRYLNEPLLDLDFDIGKVVELGNQNTSLSFSEPIRLLIPGQAGKKVGYIAPLATIFSEIQNVCESDSANAITQENQECRIDVDNDLIIWTNHLTEFVTYEEIDEEYESENISLDEEEQSTTNLAQTGIGVSLVFYISLILSLPIILKRTNSSI
jgi:uncharacterized repeat protein (TIGR02543 family)